MQVGAGGPAGTQESLRATGGGVLPFTGFDLALIVGGWLVPGLVLAIALGVGARAGVLRALGSVAAVTAPIVASIILINLFLFLLRIFGQSR